MTAPLAVSFPVDPSGAQLDDLATLLRAIPMFAILGEDGIANVVERCEFRQIPGGALLCAQGSAGAELFVVVTGRLRAVRTDGDTRRVLGEIGRGELMGEMALLTDGVRTADLMAIRDTVVAALSKATFDTLVAAHPRIVREIARLMVGRLSVARSAAAPAYAETLCLVPAGGSPADLAGFAARAAAALAVHGPVAEASADAARGAGGNLGEWLNGLEATNRFVIYIADGTDTPWTRLCLRQADLVLRVADAAGASDLSAVERLIATLPALRAAQQLILLHPAATVLPRDTRRWLDVRPGLAGHLHLRAGSDAEAARLARMLTRQPHGLVLGGGGARGFAHVGVYQVLSDAGFAVDMVGGTSIGAAFAALIAMGLRPQEVVEACGVFGEEKVDYTLPLISLSGGFGLAAAARKLFRDVMIEDLWLPYFSVTTNLTQAEMNVHRAGPLAKWVRASCSLPGALPPVFDGRELHADGCLLNNLPVDVMRERCAGSIVAVDIDQSAEIYTDLPYHEGLSGWRMAARRLWPFGRSHRLPVLPKLFHRALMIASVRNAAPARSMADLYLSPPVENCGVFDWNKGPRVMADACRYAAPHIAAWRWPGRRESEQHAEP
jgi:predicted acylesterase/phospholipase RssA